MIPGLVGGSVPSAAAPSPVGGMNSILIVP